MAEKTVKVEQHRVDAAISPQSIDSENRTVEVVWSTGERIRHSNFELGEFDLTLGLEPENVELDRINRGGAVLNSHGRHSIENVIGAPENVRVEDGQGLATLRFSKRDDVTPIFQDIEDRIIKNVSVGTRPLRLVDITQDGDPVPHYFGALHQPEEISVVPIGADSGAQTQSQDADALFDCEIVTQGALVAQKESSMAKHEATATKAAEEKTEVVEQASAEQGRPEAKASELPAAAAVEQGAGVPDESAITQAATLAERDRVATITELVVQMNLPTEFGAELVKDGSSVEQARKAVLDRLAEEDEKVETRSHVSIGRDESQTRVDGITQALSHRVAPAENEITEQSAPYVGLSLLEIGRLVLQSHGVSVTGVSKLQIAEQAMHSTSDFPEILANTANKALRRAYEESPQTYQPFTSESTAPNFKEMARVQLGEAPNLEVVGENGEFTRGTVGEGAEKYSIATYGKVFAITRQTIVNDDMSAFSRLPVAFGRAAARLESDTVWGIITANANMADGVALFHATHANLAASGGAISVTTLSAGRAAMRKQKGLDGTSPLNLRPSYLIVPAALETVGQQFIAQNIVGTKASDTNPFQGSMELITEPRLDDDSATAWYLSASPMAVDTVEYAYLEGQRGVYLETRNGFDVDGMELKARLDFGAKAIDHRGLYKNAGA